MPFLRTNPRLQMEANHPDDIPQRLVAALADRYRIERALGAGGMATVYLAQDLKHARKVAIKVLKPELAAVLGAERFLTEIRTTANLSHPHILPLFDSGEADTYLYYVMPFIEGESLLDRLERERQLPVEEAVRIASDVADALDYAHRHGVIHRDVKPANILLHDGRPMVADFGIALAISAAGGGRLTETGLSLGTPHYMSPEQASAERDLTARSDVYSLGCVLYEMLAGEPPHTGPTAAAILMRILTEQPRPISELRATVPPHVAATVSKALEKLPADRFESARDFRQALGNPAFQYTRAQVAAAATPKMGGPSAQAAARGWDARSLTLGGTTVALAAAVAWLSLGEPAPVTDRGELVSFQLVDSVPAVGYQPVAGPGGWIGWMEGGVLAARAPGSTDATRSIGARTTSLATFAPDGEWIAYAQSDGSETVLRKVPARGGSPVTLLETREPILTPHWGDDGWIYFSVLKGGGSFVAGRIRESGGAMDTLLAPSAHIPYYFAKLPGRAALLVGMHTQAATQPSILALDLESGDTATVVERGYHPVWSPSGHLLFARNEGAIFAVPFDLRSLRPTGSPVPVVDSLSEQFPLARFTLSPGGTLVYVAGPGGRTGSGNNLSPKLVGVNGERESIPLPPSIHLDARLS
ncbi:MAG TPA: serine/threonine-protein kinase, partial [Gemmatimonadaceae bacterium]